jgi:hypothetical protein
MGFNISGLVIDKNYKNSIAELESILEEKMIFEKEVTFEEASENWKGDKYCDVYFSEEGTLVFLSIESGGYELYPKKQNAFSFVLSEMMMMFAINYVENGFNIRAYMETEGEILENEGEPFDFEAQQEDKSELIYHLIEEILGKSFHDVDLDAVCYRYKFSSVEEPKIIIDEEKNEVPKSVVVERNVVTESEDTKEAKPWWKFW